MSTRQWQRIVPARAFFRKLLLILLDEPTSAMGPWAEADWIRKLLAQTQDKTVFMITHRFTTASKANLIYVLHEGVILKYESHPE